MPRTLETLPGRLRNAAAFAAALLGASAALGSDAATSVPPTPVRQIVLIVLDTVRADHLGVYGYETHPTTPRLDAFAASARVFEHAYSTSSWTLPAMASLFTGELPGHHGAGVIAPGAGTPEIRIEPRPGASGIGALREDVPTLAEALSAGGLETGAIVNNPFLAEAFGLARGFAHYDYSRKANQAIRRADATFESALRWIDDRGEAPFFLLVHLIDPHMAYDPPESVRGRFTRSIDERRSLPVRSTRAIRAGRGARSDRDRRFIAAAYDEELLGLDAALGTFLAAVERRGLLDEGWVLVTADHGEELFEHGGFEHGHAQWQSLLRVPLLVWGRGVVAGRESSPVSLADLAPTLAAAAGVSLGENLAGRSLLPNLVQGQPLAIRPLVSEGNLYAPQQRSYLAWPHKLIETLDETRPLQLFDLAADPAEAHDLSSTRAARSRALQRDLAEYLEATGRAGGSAQPVSIPVEEEGELKALGYVD